jgi:hypothetical protein
MKNKLVVGMAVLTESPAGVRPAVICRINQDKYLLSNVYCPSPKTPEGFTWAGWYKLDDIVYPSKKCDD